MLRVGPDKEDGVHDWDEEISHLIELLGVINEVDEEVLKSVKVFEVLTSFKLGNLNFLLELGEWTSVGGFVLFQELKNLLNVLRVELFADVLEVSALVFPELDFNKGIWVVAILELRLWVLLKDVLDLFAPLNDGRLEEVRFILGRGLLVLHNLSWWLWKKSLIVDLTFSDQSVRSETVEFVHEIFGDQIGPSKHVERVSKNWHENIVTDAVEVFDDWFVDFHHNNLGVDVVRVEHQLFWKTLWRSGSQNEKDLLLDLIV